MEWDEYRDLLSSEGYRSDVPALFADPEVFDEFVADFVDAVDVDADTVDRAAAIDALGFIPGTVLARELGVGLITVRKDRKLPIDEAHRVADSLVDYTGEEKTLEVDVRKVPDGTRIVVVDDWMETASQVTTAIDLIERAGGDVCGIAVLNAAENETTRRLHEEYGVYSVSPWPD